MEILACIPVSWPKSARACRTVRPSCSALRWISCLIMCIPNKPPFGLPTWAGRAVRTSTDNGCASAGDKRHLPLALPFRVRDEWGRLLASLTRPVFVQFADDRQRCVVVQIKREPFWLVLLGCGFRVHVLGCGRAASWTEPDHGRAAARERGCRAGIRTQAGACIGCTRHTSLLLTAGFRPASVHHP